jgi:hypothetical protein
MIRSFAVAASFFTVLTLLAPTGCGSDDSAGAAPNDAAGAGVCATTTGGLTAVTLPADPFGAGFLAASVDGAWTIDKRIYRVDLATGAHTQVLPTALSIEVAKDGLALAKTSGGPQTELAWIHADGTLDEQRSAVPSTLSWLAVTPTGAIGQRPAPDDGSTGATLHRLDRATGELTALPPPMLDGGELLGLGRQDATALGQTDRYFVTGYPEQNPDQGFALLVVPLDGASAPRLVRVPGGASEAVPMTTLGSRVFLRWRPLESDDYRPRVLMIDPDLPEQAVDLGVVAHQPGTTGWSATLGYAVTSTSQLTIAYQWLTTGPDGRLASSVEWMTSDLTPSSLASAGCLTALAAPAFCGHPSTGLFARDSLAPAVTFYRLAP